MKTILTFSFFFLQAIVTAQPFLMQTNRFAGMNNGTVFNILTTTDKYNQMYLCGRYHGPIDFDLGPSQFTLQPGAGFFICKYTSTGNLIWARGIDGGGNNSACRAITIDSRGNVVVAGEFDAMIDFDPGPGIHQLYAQGTYPPNWGSSGFFVLELDSTGNFVFANGWDGPKNDHVTALDVDQNDNVYLTGLFTDSLDLDPGTNVTMGNSGNYYSTFFLQLSSSGNLNWARVLDGNIRTTSLKVDKYNNVVIGGQFYGVVDFDPGSAVVSFTSAPHPTNTYTYSGFIAHFGQQAGVLSNIITFPAGRVESLVLDSNHDLLYSGSFTGGDFDPGPGVTSYSTVNSLPDVFFGKFSAAGSHLWTKQLPGSGTENGSMLDIDKQNNIVLMFNMTNSCDLDPGQGVKTVASGGNFTANINTVFTKFDPSGNFTCGDVFKTAMWTFLQSVSTDEIGKIYTTIFTDDTISIMLGSSALMLGPATSYRQSSVLVQLNCGDIITTGLASREHEPLSVYPVPSSGKVAFRCSQLDSPFTLDLFGVKGQRVFTQTFTDGPRDEFIIDLTRYEEGIYLLKINTGSSVKTGKVILERN